MARLGNKIKIIDYDSMSRNWTQVHIIHVSNSNYTTYQNDT